MKENYSHFLFSFLSILIKIGYPCRTEDARDRPEFENTELSVSNKELKNLCDLIDIRMSHIKENKMLDVSTASPKELIAMAVKAEMDSNQAYSDLASNLSNPLLKEKFQWLAYEENKHKEILEKIYATLSPGDEIPIPDKVDEDLLPSIHLTPSSSLVEILNQAMESERSAENFYAALTQRVEEAQKKVLEYLSKVEHSHYMMLKSEYALAQEFEDYAEKDIDKVIT